MQALETYQQLTRAADSVSNSLSRTLKPHGITLSQLSVMDTLRVNGPLHQRLIGQKLLRSSGNITTVVDNLERRGLVRRKRGVRDRRFVTVHLTPSGKALLESLLPGWQVEVQAAMAVLSREDQATLARLCESLEVAPDDDGEPANK